MKFRSFILMLIIACVSITKLACATATSDALGNCMTDSLSGKERKQFVEYVFMGIAAHPEMKKFSNVTAQDQTDLNKMMAVLFTRLLTVDCVEQVKQAAKEGGPQAFQSAFEIVGRLAMQDLMSNKEVNNSMSGFLNYIDKDKFKALEGR